MTFDEHLLTPASLFVFGLVCLALVVLLTFYAVWIYARAKKIAPLMKKREDLEKEVADLEKGISIAQQTLEKSRCALDEVHRSNAKILAERNLNQEITDGLKKDIEKEKQNCAHWRKEADDARDFFSKLNEQRTQLESQKALLLEDISQKNQDLGKISEKIQQANDVLEKIRDDSKNAQNELNRDLESLLQRKAITEGEIRLKEGELKSQEACLDLVLKKEKEYSDKVLTLKSELESLKREIENKAQDLENKIRELANKDLKIKEKEAELKRREKEQTKALEDKVAIKKNELSRLDEELRRRGISLGGTNEFAWASLEEPVFGVGQPMSAAKIKEEVWLSEFSNNLKKANLSFDERIIKAFHTSLKSADAMPISVLSGISGTGKSLLPQLYAKASGMNFLPIPVQPRWDGPQDIFGFYNYIESCYKATPLARLLWQYREGKNADLPMTIVLLDEMNLARVEYYFSELLSKMEILRTGDYNAAAIILECSGRGQASEDKKALFTRKLPLRKNVLFVGTMNEDETTQTLSDKVLDRSAVMRFGHPQKLEIRPDIQKFNNAYDGQKKYLSYEVWQTLLKSVLSSSAEKSLGNLEDLLVRTNSAMAKVDRPFGHRIANAIRTYVANYPGNIGNAISDVYEMKIFPKLNGLEMDSPVFSELQDSIRTILDSKGRDGKLIFDDELRNAFEQASVQNHAYFKWRGIAR